MPGRRTSRGRGGRRSRPKWAWNGSFLGVAQTPSDVIVNIHVLYDPREAGGDNESEVTVYRVVGNGSIENPAAGNTQWGWGVYVVEQNDAGAITTSTDPIGITAEEIESRNVLYHRMDHVTGVNGDNVTRINFEVDIRVRRKIKGRELLAILTRGDRSLGWQYSHRIRALIREGTL